MAALLPYLAWRAFLEAKIHVTASAQKASDNIRHSLRLYHQISFESFWDVLSLYECKRWSRKGIQFDPKCNSSRNGNRGRLSQCRTKEENQRIFEGCVSSPLSLLVAKRFAAQPLSEACPAKAATKTGEVLSVGLLLPFETIPHPTWIQSDTLHPVGHGLKSVADCKSGIVLWALLSNS